MSAEFLVQRYNERGGAGLVIYGEVESGEVNDGTTRLTFSGKRFAIIKIEKDGFPVTKAIKSEKVSIFVKYIKKEDLGPGQLLYIG